jgi:uncharacterized cofD-like protein
LHWFLKLLYPGLGLKRWLLLAVLGFLLVIGGLTVLLVGYPPAAQLVRNVVMTFLDLSEQPVVNILLLVLMGIILITYAINRIVRSLIIDYTPRRDKMVDSLYQSRQLKRGPRVVVLGGGTGLATLLRGLKHYTSNITAVVTVADDGGSSGKLRGEFGMPPPGDIRNCLIALADTEPLLEKLFQHRFQTGGLQGHSFGNLFLAAMSQILGFQQAVQELGKVLAVRGRVLPVTLDDVTLKACCVDGRIILGESRIGQVKCAIHRLELEPAHCRVSPEVLEALASAEAIIIGPGSLYTSLMPNLLVPGVAQAIRESRALKFFVCNIMTQSESRGYSAGDHLLSIREHVGHVLADYVVVNTQLVASEMKDRYFVEGAEQVKVDWDLLRRLRVKILAGRLLGAGPSARHDADSLARLILARVAAESSHRGRVLDNLLLEVRLKKR